MDSNQKKFGMYVFLSTFVILYKNGYDLKNVLIYYLLANLFSLLISYPCVAFSKKYNNKILSVIGIVAFLFLQVLLNYIVYNIWYLLSIAMIYAIYRRGYWISRRFYNLKVLKKDKISTTYSLISIINQIGVIISAYCGSLVLDFIGIKLLTIIAILLFLVSIIPLYKIKFKHEKNDVKLEPYKTIRLIPKSNLYLFGSYELLNVVKFLFPLYIFIYVKNTYHTIGVVNLTTNLALILFTYLYGKKLDTTKNNFLKLSILFTVSVYILKANSIGYMLLIISFLEGIATKMYELSISKEFYTLSKKFEYYNYNLIYEIIQNLFRTLVVMVLLLMNLELKIMIYITLLFILIGIFLKFKQINGENYKFKE